MRTRMRKRIPRMTPKMWALTWALTRAVQLAVQPMIVRVSCAGSCVVVMAGLGFSVAAAAQTAKPGGGAAQLPADARAYKAAQAVVEPEARLAAMQAFVKDYPKSNRVDRAQGQVLDVLLKNYPERGEAIAQQAKRIVKAAGKGGKQTQQMYTAFELADAGPHGVDLPLAEKWAKDSLGKLNEAKYDKDQTAMYVKFKMPAPKAEALHKEYGENRATALAALADVYVHEGKEDQAAALLREAAGLAPKDEEVTELAGQVAYDKHDSAAALKDWERASVEGTLDKKRRAAMVMLYAAAHAGTAGQQADGLQAALDAEYRGLYPVPFTPEKPAGVAGGHTALLELFTGSACPPCVGGDLAVDGMLGVYPKSELVVLAMDQHIPEPDPLANADTIARAEVYGVGHTPSYVLDGKQLDMYGGGRDDSKELYGDIAPVLDKEAKVAPAVTLELTASLGADGKVTAQAVVAAKDEAAAVAEIADEAAAMKPKPKAGEKTVVQVAAKAGTKPTATMAVTTMKPVAGSTPVVAGAAAPVAVVPVVVPVAPKLVLHFALVEDEVRYSGENGVRFHRMVVRALSKNGDKDADGAFAVKPGGTATVLVAFDPAAISETLKAYLTNYETHNERFGKVEFLSTDTAMDPKHLGVAAWVQDAVTHQVLQAAYVPLVVADGKEEASR
jgi:tetratricopeptide (TPR) repeat protein